MSLRDLDIEAGSASNRSSVQTPRLDFEALSHLPDETRRGGGADDESVECEIDEDEAQTRPLVPVLKRWDSSGSTSSMGMKTIGLTGSIVLTINNITGPGILTLPQVFQESGYLITSITFIVVCITSTLAATYLADTMARIPGNSYFNRRIEFACVFEEFYGGRMKLLAQVMLVICLYSQIVSSIIATAQVLDAFIVFVNPSNTAYALSVEEGMKVLEWVGPAGHHAIMKDCNSSVEAPVPFHDGSHGDLLITLGYGVLCVLVVPFCFQNLDDNITAQKLSFLGMLLFCGVFVWHFQQQGLVTQRVPMIGDSFRHMVGSIIFNYGFIVTVPSWLNEKRTDVSVNKAMWISTSTATVLYIGIGILGAMAYDSVHGNFLNTLASPCSDDLTRISAFLFAIVCVGMSIPVFCIMIRYNLIVGEICSERMAYFWSIVPPWMISWVFYTGDSFNQVIAWSGQLNNGPVNFILPLFVSLKAMEWFLYPSGGTLDEGSSAGTSSRFDRFRTIVKPLPKMMDGIQHHIAWTMIVILTALIGVSILFSVFCMNTVYGVC